MNQELVVEEHLNQISEGDRQSIETFFGLLANAPIFIPMISSTDDLGSNSTKKVKVATFPSKGRRYVPAFTSENYFYNWSDLRFQCFSVFAGDLAFTLPEGTWLLLNPGRYNSVELSPDDLQRMASEDFVVAPLEQKAAVVAPEHETISNEAIAGAEISDEEGEELIEGEESRLEAAGSLKSTDLESEPKSAETVLSILSDICLGIPEVSEAYFLESADNSVQGLLGVLAEKMDVERRFQLISKVAEASKRLYGYAGAIDVFDDLHQITSSSWDLFKTLAPFYVREQQIEEIYKSPLSANIEKIVEPEKTEKKTSTASRKPGNKIFGVFRRDRN